MRENLFAKFVRQVNKRSNNKGSSVVLVIVAIAFVGTLVSMSAYASYYNWLAKSNDKQSKKNFYTAEQALAEINAGLQNVVGNAMSISYSYALQNNTNASMNERKISFEVMYEKQLIEQLKKDNAAHYDVDILAGYLKKTKWDDATQTGAKILTSNVSSKNENILFKKNGGVVLQNIKLMYADERGYVTYLTTDIYLQLPDINLVASVGVPELENCSIIANDSLDIINNNNIKISGNVYGGKNGMLASGDTTLSFLKKDTDVASTVYHLIASSITVENSSNANFLDVSENYDVWTEQILVESGNLSLRGSAFVRDDLTIDGKNSNIRIWGSYYGYGDELYKSENSSSILINGGNTSLDMSRLDNLMLSGHAFVGARHYDPNLETADDYVVDPNAEEEEEEATTEPLYKKNNKDLMMGESIGVKSNQLIYMVPTECMGYYAGSSEQFMAKNPMSYSEYLTLTTTYQYELNEDGTVKKDSSGNPIFKLDENGNKILQYDEVNLGIIANKVGKTLSSLGATYKPVFRKVNGSVLVYYYLDFTSDKAANEFFRLYYDKDKANMDAYIKMYIKDLKLSDSLNETNANLHLAGNAIKYNADGTVELVADTTEADLRVADSLAQNREKWLDSYTAYSKKMLSRTSLLTSKQLANDIYTNLVVDNYEFANIVPGGTTVTFENGSVKALAINNKDTGAKSLNFADLNGVNLVIASGDIKLNTNFNGLILCGGVVSIGPQCNVVTSDPVATRKAIAAKTADGTHQIAELLQDGDAYISQAPAVGISLSSNDLETKIDREQDYIKLGDLIAYENWTKH